MTQGKKQTTGHKAEVEAYALALERELPALASLPLSLSLDLVSAATVFIPDHLGCDEVMMSSR
jgi:hypothetical protein